MDQIELFRRLAVALAIGLLIGLERGWRTREEHDGARVAGLRTFALSGLLGGVSALIGQALGGVALAASLAAYAGALIWFSALEAQAENNLSVTGVVAGLATFMLGAYAVLGDQLVAVAAAVAMALLLALRDPLHEWVRRMTWIELRSTLVLLAMSFLLLPVLPNRAIDRWGALNPAEIWFFAILIAAVSFVGYVATKTLGEGRGLALAAIAGGLTSSTATTVTFARLVRENPESAPALARGAYLSGVTMLGRILVLVLMIEANLAPTVAPALAAGAGVLLAFGAPLLWRAPASDGAAPRLEMKNPFEIMPVLQIAVVISVVMILAKTLAGKAHAAGVYILAAASGVADVDALTLSMARVAGGDLTMRQAGLAILIAAGVNTVSKAVMAGAIAGPRFGLRMGGVSALALAAGGLAAVFTV
ncbi:MAG: MgtC/SapB family protein [Methylobacteriaceae bacterium]|nr:MgtC/SapB family protein [Methylobacteriaceae bacterium]